MCGDRVEQYCAGTARSLQARYIVLDDTAQSSGLYLCSFFCKMDGYWFRLVGVMVIRIVHTSSNPRRGLVLVLVMSTLELDALVPITRSYMLYIALL